MSNVFLLSIAASLIAINAAQAIGQTEEEIKNLRRDKITARVGGLLPLKGTPSGSIFFVNVNSGLATASLKYAFDQNARNLKGTDVWEDGDFVLTLDKASAYKNSKGASFVIFILKDEKLPMSLIALEEGWGIVNVSPLYSDGANEGLVKHRAQVELARVFGILCGGASSQFKSPIMNNIRKPADLNGCTTELPVDITTKMANYCSIRGVRGQRLVSYQKACQEGWAPAPTNDVQRMIWSQIHSPPTDPIKIKFDPNTDMK